MANRQSRSPGSLQQVTAKASVGDVPDFAVDTGAAARVLASLGSTLSGRLSQMADHAAANEGERAGLDAGARAGERYIAKEIAAPTAKGRKTAPAADVVVGPGEISDGPAGLSSQPLQLRHDNTIRGEAFDAAALKAYGWRFQEGLANDIGAAADANPDSPAGFEKALGGIREKYLADGIVDAEPKVRELFEGTLADRVAPMRLAIAARHEAAVKAAAKSAAIDGTEAVRAELERSAYALGANPAADWMLAGPIKRALSAIDAEVRDGTFTAKEGEARKLGVKNTVLTARTLGTFDALGTPAAKQEFALSVMKSWQGGEGAYKDLSLADAKQLSDALYQKATVEATKLTTEQKAEKARLEGALGDDLASIAGSGTGLDPKALDPGQVKLLLGDAAYDKWQAGRDVAMKTWQATTGMEAESPEDLAARLKALEPKPGQAGYEDALNIYGAAVKQRDAILEERKVDPLGQANRAGFTIAALDTTSPEALTKSLSTRAMQAALVANVYGMPVSIFRPQERTSLADALLDNPELLSSFARSAEAALGPYATQALSELSEAGPELAHAAGISLATGNNGVADDVSRVLAARKAGTFKVKIADKDGKVIDAAGAILGDVFAANDAARGAVIGTANLLFEKEANTLGFDPDQVNKPGSAAAAAYERSINRALGMQMVGGVQYGGLSDVNGTEIVAPSFMPADQPEKLITSISPADLAFLPQIQSGTGIAITAADLRGGHLVTVGDGLYRVALGDPQSFDPRFVMTPAGTYWELDMKTLDSLHRLPAYERPSRFADFIRGSTKMDAP